MRRLLVTCAVLVWCAVAVEAQTVLCESLGAYRECRVGMSGTIRLVMEMSTQSCFEGTTWGTRTAGVVWVDRGCRATFTVSTATQSHVRKNRIVCESQKGDRQVCPADTSQGVALVQQLSRTACVEGENWGFDPDRELIWVDRGCRAEFFLGPVTAPVRPPLLDNAVVCESENGRRKECKADTAGGVQIVKHLSDSPCGFGREWGYDEKGIWVNKGCRAEFAVRGKPKPVARALTCESQNDARTNCPGETQYGVAIVRQLGESPCILGESWGFDQDGVWVAGGCRAQFALGGYRLPPEAVPPSAMLVTCESRDGKESRCAAATVRGVGLVRQLSESNCVLNRTWGYDAEGIWVSEGCRAEFAVAR